MHTKARPKSRVKNSGPVKILNTLEKLPPTTTNNETQPSNPQLTTPKKEEEKLVIEIPPVTELPPMSQTAGNFFPKKEGNKLKISKKEPRIRLFSATGPVRQKYIPPKSFLVPSIPEELLDRIKLCIAIFKNEDFVKYYEATPPRISTSLDHITDYLYLYDCGHHELDKYSMFYYYLCHQITYDIKEVNKDSVDIDAIFQSGLANSYQFCKLFEYMCKRKRLRYKRLSGFCKNMVLPHYKVGSDVTKPNHYWNAFMVKGDWYFCDLTFGSGGILPKSEFVHDYFNPYYFLTPPEYFIDSHRPEDDDWQRTKKTITLNQFSLKKLLAYGPFYRQVYHHEIELISHKTPYIKSANSKLIVKLGIKNELIQAYLLQAKPQHKLGEVKFGMNDKTGVFSLEPNFPGNGNYILQILSRSMSSTDLVYNELLNFYINIDDSQLRYLEVMKEKRIRKERILKLQEEDLKKYSKKKNRPKTCRLPTSRIVTSYDLVLPSKTTKVICRDNKEYHIIEPRSQILKIGLENKVKVKVPDAAFVVLLDNKKWNYLKRTNPEIWEGNVMVNTESTSILVLKKGTNVYTEAFTLKTQKPTSTVLALFNARKEK